MNIGELAKFRGGVSVDTISELTSASGVTIDSVLLKDGNVTASASGTVTTTYVQAADTQGLGLKNSSGTSVVTVTDAGAVTVGPASGLTAGHVTQASCAATTPDQTFKTTTTTSTTTPKYIVSINRQNSSTPALYLGVDGNSSPLQASNGAGYRFGSDASGTFTETGSYSQAGAWTLGPSGANAVKQTVNGYLNVYRKTSTSTDTVFYVQSDVGSTGKVILELDGAGIYGYNPGTMRAVGVTSANILGDTTVSKRELKEDFQELNWRGVYALPVYSFKWKATQERDVGCIADEVAQHLPEFAYFDANGVAEGVNYQKIALATVKAIQEQQAIIEDLKTRLAALESK